MGIVGTYQAPRTLIDWVNEQPLAIPLTCLGDGHDGVWKLVKEISFFSQRREILDWYYLVENLHKVGGSIKRLKQGETLLWQGKVDLTIALFEPQHQRINQLQWDVFVPTYSLTNINF